MQTATRTPAQLAALETLKDLALKSAFIGAQIDALSQSERLEIPHPGAVQLQASRLYDAAERLIDEHRRSIPRYERPEAVAA